MLQPKHSGGVAHAGLSLRRCLLAADLSWAVFALGAALAARGGSWQYIQTQWLAWLPVLVLVWLLWPLLVLGLSLDGTGDSRSGLRVTSQTVMAVAVMMVVLLAGGYISRILRSRLALAYFGAAFCVGVLALRLAVLRYRNRQVVRTIILGDGQLARETARRIHRRRELGWALAGFLSLTGGDRGSEASTGEPVKGLHSTELLDFLQQATIEQVVVALEQPFPHEVSRLLEQFCDHGLRVIQVSTHFELYTRRPSMLDLDGIPLIIYDETTAPYLALGAKRLLDCSVAALLLTFTSPLWLSMAALARLRFGRAFTAHPRVGRNGAAFWMYRLNWEAASARHLIRSSGVRELPQLVNVLRGEMSLVGPRPESPEEVRHYLGPNSKRLELRPGLTGLAQINGLGEANLADDRHSYDLEYVNRWSLGRDFVILAQTAQTLWQRVLRGDARAIVLETTSTAPAGGNYASPKVLE